MKRERDITSYEDKWSELIRRMNSLVDDNELNVCRIPTVRRETYNLLMYQQLTFVIDAIYEIMREIEETDAIIEEDYND